MTKVAVVILNYNGKELLQRFLPSVLAHSEGAEVVVVDNGSADGSDALLASGFPGVRLIRLEKNLGFCGGYNQALKLVDATYYVLLNSDVEVTAGWLNAPTEVLDSNERIAAVQPKILAWKNKTQFEYAGAGGGMIDALGYPFCRGRLFHALEADEGQFNDDATIFWASGACLMVRSAAFHELGGFDEEFFAHMEEIDLCWRLQRRGFQIAYTGRSTVYHVGGGTLSSANPRKTYLNFRNGLSLLYKNLEWRETWLRMPVRVALDWVAALKFTLTGQPRDGMAVLKAHRDFFGNWRSERSKRKAALKAGTHVSGKIYPGSVVWEFFVLGKRKYNELTAR